MKKVKIQRKLQLSRHKIHELNSVTGGLPPSRPADPAPEPVQSLQICTYQRDGSVCANPITDFGGACSWYGG